MKILDKTFLFNVVEDPLERANLRDRHRDIYDRMVAQWTEWNKDMLPEVRESFTDSFDGEHLADHFGAQRATGLPDTDNAWPRSN